MAQAGFYHQPSPSGDDRAMCFTCMVCLVCWEKSDEPWVEHERHSPNCPFVRGEYTHNVPISVSICRYICMLSFVPSNYTQSKFDMECLIRKRCQATNDSLYKNIFWQSWLFRLARLNLPTYLIVLCRSNTVLANYLVWKVQYSTIYVAHRPLNIYLASFVLCHTLPMWRLSFVPQHSISQFVSSVVRH